MAYVDLKMDLNNSCFQRKYLLAWRRGKTFCAACETERQCTDVFTRTGLQHHFRICHKDLPFSNINLKDGVQSLRTRVAHETRENLEALSEQRKSLVGNVRFYKNTRKKFCCVARRAQTTSQTP